MQDREPAPPPRSWVNRLRTELARWQDDGLISTAQAEQIAARYPAEKDRDRLILTLTLLGALLVGIGVILFLAANWPGFDRWLKLAIIFSSVTAAHLAGWWLQYEHGRYERTGHALIVVGCLLYGAGIWLVAQTYHLDADFPTGMLLWALGCLPVAWATRSLPVLTLATLLLTMWTVGQQTALSSPNLAFPPLLLALVLPLVYRLRARLLLAAGLISLGVWLVLSTVVWLQDLHNFTDRAVPLTAIFAGLWLFGAALFAAGVCHRRYPACGRLERPYLVVGALAALVGAFGLTFNLGFSHPFTVAARLHLPVLAQLLLLTALALAAAWWARARLEALAVGAAVALGAVVLLAPVGGVPLMVGMNLVLLALVLALVAYGDRRQDAWLVNLALAGFVALVLARYFDLFFTLLDRSIFFIAGGLLLLAGGFWLERSRRRLVRGWKEADPHV